MGLISLIGLAIEVIKIIWEILQAIRGLKAKKKDVNVGGLIARLRAGIADYRKTGKDDMLMRLRSDVMGE